MKMYKPYHMSRSTASEPGVPGMQVGSSPPSSTIISWPGYGILFFWQLGILQYLKETFDLSSCTMVGSSAGALLSILAACGVSPQTALDLAHDLCIRHGVFERPLGLIGVWGGIVKQWLQELLPDDAAERCSGGHVRIVLTTVPYLRRRVVTDFKDRDDLIDCALASAHLPFILDWKPYANWRGQRCVDGSLLYILTRRCTALKPTSFSSLLLFDPMSDWNLLNPSSLLRCISLCGKDAAQHMLDQGVQYASKLHAVGGLDALTASGLQKGSIDSSGAEDHQRQQHNKEYLQLSDKVQIGLDEIGGDAAVLLSSSVSISSNAVKGPSCRTFEGDLLLTSCDKI